MAFLITYLTRDYQKIRGFHSPLPTSWTISLDMEVHFSYIQLVLNHILSTYAEDHGFYPWMNASVALETFMGQGTNASVDSAAGG
jgi:hypothetical protein